MNVVEFLLWVYVFSVVTTCVIIAWNLKRRGTTWAYFLLSLLILLIPIFNTYLLITALSQHLSDKIMKS